MAYATLASMPPISGLYASIMALFSYPLFSTSPQLAVGPSALMSVLTTTAITGLGVDPVEEADRFQNLAFKLTFVVGLMNLLLGLIHAGYLVNFLSHPVLKGFTMAAAIIIGSSQLSKVFRIKIPRHDHVYDTWADLVRNIGDTHMLSFGLAIENLAMFYILKYLKVFLKSLPVVKDDESRTYVRILNAIPNALIVVVLNIGIAYGGMLVDHGLKVAGDIPSGFPEATNIFDDRFSQDFVDLIPSAFVTTIIGFMESISVAKAMALRYDNDVDSNQELVGLGAANFMSCFFQGIPVTAGFSRTSVNADAGAKTPISSIITATILSIAILFLTPLFYHLPTVTLATLILFAVTKLFDFETPRMLWAVDKADFFVYCCAFVATIVFGIEIGIIIGTAVSLARLIKEAAQPHVARLGKLPGTNKWRNIKRFGGAPLEVQGLTVVRFDAQLFFANTACFKELILKLSKPIGDAMTAEAIVLDCSAMASLDSSAIHAIEALPKEMTKNARRRRERRIAKVMNEIRRIESGKGPSQSDGADSATNSKITPSGTGSMQSVEDHACGDLE